MPYIPSFIYAESITAFNVPSLNDPTKTEQKIQVTGPSAFLKPLYIPGAISFSVTCTILDFDHSITHTLRLCFMKQESDIFLADTGTSEIPPHENEADITLPTHLRGLNIALDFKNVDIKEIGVYVTKVFVDDVVIGIFPIEIWRMPS